MKIDRLLGIITVLLQQNKATAPELAEKFEVSRRTIYRDIDDICKAGIPLITCQGGDGGIFIADGFKFDKSILSVEELQNILTGLKSLGSVSNTPRIERLISKLSPKNEAVVSIKENILIDLSSHYKSSLSEKISMIKQAISERKLINFDYYSEKGLSNRTIEPYFITFRWASWYIFAYCINQKDFRLFKLNRLWKQRMLEEIFEEREVPADKTNFDTYLNDSSSIKVIFDNSVEFLIVEEYGPDSYKKLEDGKLEFTTGYTNKEYIIKWLLGFGDKAIIIEPLELARELKNIAKNILHNYEHDI